MDEFISREATIKRIEEVYCVGGNSYHGVRCRACGTGDAIDIIDDFPAADVAPVRNARWERYGKNLGECSECGEIVSVQSNYCPNCGAKMDGGAD